MAIFPETPIARILIHDSHHTPKDGRILEWEKPVTAEVAARTALAMTGMGSDAYALMWQPGKIWADVETGFIWQFLPEHERAWYLYAWRGGEWVRIYQMPATMETVERFIEQGKIQPGERWMLAYDRGGSVVANRGRVPKRKTATRK
jgi:hypothetical protein